MTIVAEPTALDTTDENPLVKVVERKNWMGAFRVGTGELLADAQRRGAHQDDEWCGWAIKAHNHPTRVVESRVLAKYMVTEYATDLVGGAR